MMERDFRRRLIQEFEAEHREGSFIWAHDVHFKAGFPDIYWILGGRSYHAELKVCRAFKMPANPWDLCTKIQVHVAERLWRAGAEVHLIVAHAPPRGERKVYFVTAQSSRAFSASSFWPFWRSLR